MKQKAPYKPGDLVQVLHYDETYGTCLATVPVTKIREAMTNGMWEIAFTYPSGRLGLSEVKANGQDRHGYVIPVVTR